MVRRLTDITLSLMALILSSPLFVIAAVGIWLIGPGPVLYRAKRVGLNGKIFTIYKLRTMLDNQSSSSSPITAKDDPRVYAFGAWLRRLKIDELPQLFNVLRGEMSIVGPRPEDPRIVNKYYTLDHLETLRILPGLASPGSIYNYTHGEQILETGKQEKYYIERLLPLKLALDVIYVREASYTYDIRIVLRTIWVILSAAMGKRHYPDPPEMKKARHLLRVAE